MAEADRGGPALDGAEEARLADPSLAGDEQEASLAGRDRLEEPTDMLQVFISPDQDRAEPRPRSPCRPTGHDRGDESEPCQRTDAGYGKSRVHST